MDQESGELMEIRSTLHAIVGSRRVLVCKEWAQRQTTRGEEVAAIAKALEILKEEAVKEALLQDTAQCSQQLRVEGPQGVSFRVFLVSFGAVFQGGVSEHEGGQFRIKPGSVSVPCRGSVSGFVCRKLPIPALESKVPHAKPHNPTNLHERARWRAPDPAQFHTPSLALQTCTAR